MIKAFEGEYRFLSNFWPSEVEFEGVKYQTVEAAFAAAKTLNPVERFAIASAPTPGEAKRLGRKVTLRENWNDLRVNVMRKLVLDKFLHHDDLCAKLLATGMKILEEGNNWGDRYWGVDLATGVGENKLGNILMDVRIELGAVVSDVLPGI